MQIDLSSLSTHLATLAWVGLRSFFKSFFLMLLYGALLAFGSYYFLREESWGYGVGAVVVTVVEAIALGFSLGSKRALAAILVHCIRGLSLGRLFVRLVFSRFVEPDSAVSRGLEKVPLAIAERMLTGAVTRVTGDIGQGGFLRRLVQGQLLGGVQKYTLARFRAEDSTHGGIDARRVQEELERTIDDVLAERVSWTSQVWTVFVIAGLPLVVALQTWLLLRWIHAQNG